MTETIEEPGIFDPSECPNSVIDAVRSMFSVVGQDVTCDKAKGILILTVLAIVGIVVLKFFVFKK